MPPLIDLTGQKIGKVTVIRRAPSRGNLTFWRCRCSCGRFKNLSLKYLQKSILPSCGCSKSENYRKSKIGHLNPLWKGDRVGYATLHVWIRKRKPRPFWCEKCQSAAPYDVANISGQYKREISDFEWLCRKCHMENDGRLSRLINSPGNQNRDPYTGRYV